MDSCFGCLGSFLICVGVSVMLIEVAKGFPATRFICNKVSMWRNSK